MLCYLLLGVVTATLCGYGVLRLVELHTMNSLPVVAELFELPLPKLYRWATRAERARLRKRRTTSTMACSLGRLVHGLNDAFKLLTMHVIGWIPTRDFRGLRLEQTLQRAIVGIDRVVDKDAKPMVGTRYEFFKHVTRVIEGLTDLASLREHAVPEELCLIYTVRATQELLGFDSISAMQRTWQGYKPDALRILADAPVTNRLTLQMASQAYAELETLGGLILGLDATQAALYAELAMGSFLAHDRLADLLLDARANQFAIPQEEFDAAGFSAADLHAHSSSLEDLATVPGLAEWCVAQAQLHGSALRDERLPRLKREVLPYIRPRWAGKLLTGSFESRVESFERMRQWWQEYVPKPVPTKPSAGWLWLADYYEGGAKGFGLPVSEDTKERWRLVSTAWFWIDYLLDESPEPKRAQEIFHQLLSVPTPALSELPDWPVLPSVIVAIERWKESTSGLSSYDRIIQMSRELGGFAVVKPHVKSVIAYARQLMVEDALNGELEAECMSDEERAHPAFGQFRRWCGWFFTTCGALDARIDLKKDYRKHQVNVRPTWANRQILRIYLWGVSARLIARHPHVFLTFAEAVRSRRAEVQSPREREGVRQ